MGQAIKLGEGEGERHAPRVRLPVRIGFVVLLNAMPTVAVSKEARPATLADLVEVADPDLDPDSAARAGDTGKSLSRTRKFRASDGAITAATLQELAMVPHPAWQVAEGLASLTTSVRRAGGSPAAVRAEVWLNNLPILGSEILASTNEGGTEATLVEPMINGLVDLAGVWSEETRAVLSRQLLPGERLVEGEFYVLGQRTGIVRKVPYFEAHSAVGGPPRNAWFALPTEDGLFVTGLRDAQPGHYGDVIAVTPTNVSPRGVIFDSSTAGVWLSSETDWLLNGGDAIFDVVTCRLGNEPACGESGLNITRYSGNNLYHEFPNPLGTATTAAETVTAFLQSEALANRLADIGLAKTIGSLGFQYENLVNLTTNVPLSEFSSGPGSHWRAWGWWDQCEIQLGVGFGDNAPSLGSAAHEWGHHVNHSVGPSGGFHYSEADHGTMPSALEEGLAEYWREKANWGIGPNALNSRNGRYDIRCDVNGLNGCSWITLDPLATQDTYVWPADTCPNIILDPVPRYCKAHTNARVVADTLVDLRSELEGQLPAIAKDETQTQVGMVSLGIAKSPYSNCIWPACPSVTEIGRYQRPGAIKLRAIIDIDYLEPTYDWVQVENAAGGVFGTLWGLSAPGTADHGKRLGVATPWVDGDTIVFKLRADDYIHENSVTHASGFRVKAIEVSGGGDFFDRYYLTQMARTPTLTTGMTNVEWATVALPGGMTTPTQVNITVFGPWHKYLDYLYVLRNSGVEACAWSEELLTGQQAVFSCTLTDSVARLRVTTKFVSPLGAAVVTGLQVVKPLLPPSVRHEAFLGGTKHPYDTNLTWQNQFTYTKPGAARIRAVLRGLDLRPDDEIAVTAASGAAVYYLEPESSGGGDLTTGWITGDTIKLNLYSHAFERGYGFDVVRVEWQTTIGGTTFPNTAPFGATLAQTTHPLYENNFSGVIFSQTHIGAAQLQLVLGPLQLAAGDVVTISGTSGTVCTLTYLNNTYGQVTTCAVPGDFISARLTTNAAGTAYGFDVIALEHAGWGTLTDRLVLRATNKLLYADGLFDLRNKLVTSDEELFPAAFARHRQQIFRSFMNHGVGDSLAAGCSASCATCYGAGSGRCN